MKKHHIDCISVMAVKNLATWIGDNVSPLSLMFKTIAITALLALGAAQPVLAQTDAPEAPVSDIDEIITNNKMRAQTGSKSKYSISNSFSYAGGSLEDPLGSVRPNISGATGSTDVALLSGGIGLRYALSVQNALYANVGVRWITPLAGLQKPANYNGDKWDADNPGISFQHVYRWGKVQSALQASETFFTNSNLLRLGFLTSWGVSQNNVVEIGNTGLSFGLTASAGYAVFTKSDAADEAHQSDFNFSLLPFLEYKITQRLDVNTSFNLFSFQHLRTANVGTYQRQIVTQSFGFGYEVYRDFYIGPGLLWIPGKLAADTTLVSLSATFNLF